MQYIFQIEELRVDPTWVIRYDQLPSGIQCSNQRCIPHTLFDFMMPKMNCIAGRAKAHLMNVSSKMKIVASVIGLLILLEG